MCGSSVYFGDFSFLRQLRWLLLRASGEGWGERRHSPEWWMGRVTMSAAADLVWTLGAVKGPAQYWASASILPACKRKTVVSVSFWGRGWFVPLVCRADVAIWDTASLSHRIYTPMLISPHCSDETSLSNEEQWQNMSPCGDGRCRTGSRAQRWVQDGLHPQGYCAVPGAASDGHLHIHPHDREFLMTQQL